MTSARALPYIGDPRIRQQITLKLTEDDVQMIRDTQELLRVQAAPAAKHPIGFNVRQGVDYARLLEQAKRMGGCTALLFHVDASSLHVLQQFKPYVDVLVWRPRPKSGETWSSESLYVDFKSPEQWVTDRHNEILAAGFGHDELWLHLHNESGWNMQMIDWERRAIEHGLLPNGAGMKFVALNPSVGTPNEADIPLARPIIEFAGQHPEQVIIGLHEYFSVWGNRKKPWYIGRWQWWETYRRAEKLPAVRYLITEFGSEDITNDHPDTQFWPRVKGIDIVGPVHANDAAWERDYRSSPPNADAKMYPGKDAAYLEQIKIAWEVGGYADAAIVGLLLFSWGAG